MDRTELEKLPDPVRVAHERILNLVTTWPATFKDDRNQKKLILILRRLHLSTKLETLEEIEP